MGNVVLQIQSIKDLRARIAVPITLRYLINVTFIIKLFNFAVCLYGGGSECIIYERERQVSNRRHQYSLFHQWDTYQLVNYIKHQKINQTTAELPFV